MNNKQFYQKLQEKIPYWQARGWLEPDAATKILHDVLTTTHKSHRLSLILGIMGTVLLVAGAISFFAANWQGMSKLFKLSLLFSSMTIAYLVAAYSLSGQRHPSLGQAFLLLGVLLFGNNVLLIAQIYHIDSHYPNGILLWAVGALMTAIIMRSEIILIAATLLALLWSGMEIFDFRQIHWPYLMFWFASVVLVLRQGFHLAVHFIILSLICWSLFSFNSFSRYTSEGVIVQIYLLAGIAVFMLSRTLKARYYWPVFNENLSRYALLFALLFIYVLSFPGLDLYSSLSHTALAHKIEGQMVWLVINLALMILILVLLMGRLKSIHGSIPRYKLIAFIWLTILFATLLMNIFLYQDQQSISVIMINILLFMLVVWLVYAGLVEHKRFYINTAFVIFTITLISRYFDTFWSLMDHSLFFIIGGLLLIIGGYWLEKKRRQLSKHLQQTDEHYSLLEHEKDINFKQWAGKKNLKKNILPAILLIITVQLLLLVAMIANRQNILSSDTVVVLQTRPIDPRSLFRGDYVHLSYDINNLQLDELSGDRQFKVNDSVYVVLEKSGQYWDAQGIYLHWPVLTKTQRNSQKEPAIIQGVVKTVNNRQGNQDNETAVEVSSLYVSYGIENYFVPEGEGLKLERPEPGDKVTLEIALDKAGHAAIKTLLLNGVPQYQEALF